MQRRRLAPWRGFQERWDRVGGIVTLTASPRPLKFNALVTFRLGARAYRGMDYAEIDSPHGEIQIFHDYRRRVSAAQVARREILTDLPGPIDRDDLDPLIWDRSAMIRRRHIPPVP